MIVAIDNSPIVFSHRLSDKIRGTGFYIKNLIEALQKYHPEHTYVFFTQGEKVPKADVYHYPYFEPFFFSLPGTLPGKTVVTVHDLTPLVFPELFPVGIKGKLKFAIQKRRVKRADAVITDSESSKTDIHKILGIPDSKTYSIPLAPADFYKKINMVPTEKRKLIEKYRIPEKFVLYVGDATPNKNLKRLVDAAVLGKFPLVMVGGALAKKNVSKHPWNRDLLYVQKVSETNPNIFLTGYVSDTDLSLLYNTASVFAFPSLYEGFGFPVLEAAICGCPVVTSYGGSLPEVMGDAALYADPHSVEDISKKILQMFNDKKMQETYSKMGIMQSKKFSWEETAGNTIKVYEKIYQEA